jgi:hypothetical protein
VLWKNVYDFSFSVVFPMKNCQQGHQGWKYLRTNKRNLMEIVGNKNKFNWNDLCKQIELSWTLILLLNANIHWHLMDIRMSLSTFSQTQRTEFNWLELKMW